VNYNSSSNRDEVFGHEFIKFELVLIRSQQIIIQNWSWNYFNHSKKLSIRIKVINQNILKVLSVLE